MGTKMHLGDLGSPVVQCGLFLILYNNVVNLIPPAVHARLYVGLNVLVLIILWSYAHRYWNFRPADAGIRAGGFWTSLGLGICLAAIIIIPFYIALVILPKIGISLPAIHLDEVDQEGLIRRLLVRIPVGTVLFEEMLFRGIFLGLLLREQNRPRALIVSSFVFGVWHIVPALKVMFRNFGVSSILPGIGMFILGIIGAVIAGYVFGWVRIRKNNIIGPVIAHLLINDTALVLIYFMWRA
ncbi:MAG TPA: type II CAAX endopeptidase family protein [bacterium]